MSPKPSLIQLSTYDPQMGIPEGSHFEDKCVVYAKRNSKKEEILGRFKTSKDPTERKRLLDQVLKG